MKTLILAGFVAFISMQALADGTCPFRNNTKLDSAKQVATANQDAQLLPGASAPQLQQQVARPAVRAAGASGTNL